MSDITDAPMKSSHKLTLIVLGLVAAAIIIALVLTGGSPASEVKAGSPPAAGAPGFPAIEQQKLETARHLARLAATPQEHALAQNAVRAADAELDLAFAMALRDASTEAAPETQETREARQRIGQTAAQVKADQESIKQLTAQAANAKGADQSSLHQQIELAQAELALDQDALADANQDLARAGGDPYNSIQRLWKQHEDAEHAGGAAASSAGGSIAFSSNSLVARWRSWNALRTMQGELAAAQRDAIRGAAALAREHDALEQRVANEQTNKQTVAGEAATIPGGGSAAGGSSKPQDAKAALSLLHQLSQDEKDLAVLDQRVQDLQDLSTAYSQWQASVAARRRGALHAMLKSALWIILAILFVFLASRLIEHSFTEARLERKQLATLRGVVRFTIEALAVLVVLLVIFGAPTQMSTVLGLAGAGLTVALKDFVVSFFGWFVLMGPNGVRVGDWVEVNGVRGEVIEIGLLRTILLETGNWTEPGHPTGRKVSFLNSFAVEGYYFNFTTSGQWLWDEITLLIPWGSDPYPVTDKIYDIVAKETERNVQLAEQEWQRVTRRYGVKFLPAKPSVNVRSTEQGVEVTVRYITRANERPELRSRLNHAAVKLIHGGKAEPSATDVAPEAEPTETSASRTPDR